MLMRFFVEQYSFEISSYENNVLYEPLADFTPGTRFSFERAIMDIKEEHSQKMICTSLHYSDRDESLETDDVQVYLRKRYLVTLLVFLDYTVIFSMNMNLGISIVDMTSNKTVTIGNETFVEEAEFHWSSKTKGVILSASSLGIMTGPLGALATKRYGGIPSFGAATAVLGLLSILTPVILSWSTTVFLVVQVVQGIMEGIVATSVVEVLRLWSIPSERSRTFAAVPAGIVFGSILGFPLYGTIIQLLNWRASYYIAGGLILIWSIIWFSVVSTPEKDNQMSAKERRFILIANKSSSTRKVKYPWKKIFKSKAVWAYWNERFVEAWCTAFMHNCLPLFIKDVHDVNIQEIGFISGIPHLCGIVGTVGASILADFLRKNRILSSSSVHRLYLSFGQIVAIVLLITASLWRNFIANIIIFSLFRVCFNFACISYMVLPVDMAGQYAPTIIGFGMACFAFAFCLSPLVMGFIVSNHSPYEWSIYFMVLSVFNLWSAVIFYWFGSGSLQPWAVLPDICADETKNEQKSETPLQFDIN